MTVKGQSVIEEDGPDSHLHVRASTVSIMTCPEGRKGVGEREFLSPLNKGPTR